jgi:hypothetical protein
MRLPLLTVMLLALAAPTPPSLPPNSLLLELPEAEGKDIRLPFPYELCLATFQRDEGSYGSGPRILIITNGLEPPQAIANLRGERTVFELTSNRDDNCDEGDIRTERFNAPGAVITTWFQTSPGEESCWVSGTIRVTVGTETQVYRVKGASGL